eukprot:260416-Rhodomonas_salina.1
MFEGHFETQRFGPRASMTSWRFGAVFLGTVQMGQMARRGAAVCRVPLDSDDARDHALRHDGVHEGLACRVVARR